MIYFIQSSDGAGPIKIGVAVNLTKRLGEVQRMSPVTLKVIASIEGSHREEVELHKRFADCRLHGEWFNPTEKLLGFIACPTEIKVQDRAARPPTFNVPMSLITSLKVRAGEVPPGVVIRRLLEKYVRNEVEV